MKKLAPIVPYICAPISVVISSHIWWLVLCDLETFLPHDTAMNVVGVGIVFQIASVMGVFCWAFNEQ